MDGSCEPVPPRAHTATAPLPNTALLSTARPSSKAAPCKSCNIKSHLGYRCGPSRPTWWMFLAANVVVKCSSSAAPAPTHGTSSSFRSNARFALVMDPADGLQQQYSAEDLRRTIEEGVLNALVKSMSDHVDLVENGGRSARPFVTLTYAQSVDGSIAAADKSQVSLSGKESRAMTHGLRSIHDAILVGAGTIRQDDPRLNVRHWPPQESSLSTYPPSSAADSACEENRVTRGTSPRAVILAASLSELPRSMRLGGAVIFTNLYSPQAWRWLAEWASRSREGSRDRAANKIVIVNCRLTSDGRCDVGDCLEKLYSMGFRSLMVEGGANVISSFLRGLDRDGTDKRGFRSKGNSSLVNRVIVTIAPVFLQGYNVLTKPPAQSDGSVASAPSGFPLSLLDVHYVPLGEDIVMVGTPR